MKNIWYAIGGLVGAYLLKQKAKQTPNSPNAKTVEGPAKVEPSIKTKPQAPIAWNMWTPSPAPVPPLPSSSFQFPISGSFPFIRENPIVEASNIEGKYGATRPSWAPKGSVPSTFVTGAWVITKYSPGWREGMLPGSLVVYPPGYTGPVIA